jgi:rhamnosyltransferase
MKPIMTGEARKSPRCSIIIRAYNEEKHIGRLLAGISQQNLADIEVILVDSGSEDATIEIATGFNSSFPVRVIHIQPEEFTFGRSLNLGVREARSDIIIMASAHVYPVYPDWLERLVIPFSDPQVGLAYGRQRGNNRTRFSEQQVFGRWFPERSQPRQSFPFCNNANAAIRRSLWEQRPYDETLSGLEDLDWARWVMHQGYAISYVAEAEIVHIHAETPRGVYNRYRREAMAFKHIYHQETFGFFDFLRLTTSNIVSDLWHATRQGRILEHFGSIFWFRSMQFWGTYQGYRQTGPLTWQLRQTFYYPNDLNPSDKNQPRKVEPIQYNDMESK